jgi:hypothetical protein
MLSIRLNAEEFYALHRRADELELTVSALVRGWILTQFAADGDGSPAATVDRIARQVEQLRRQPAPQHRLARSSASLTP